MTSDSMQYDRNFFTSENEMSRIGKGEIGGKARGLLDISGMLRQRSERCASGEITISIPRMTVITTEYFDEFIAQNNLFELATAGLPDERIAKAFQNADLPPRLVGDIRALAEEATAPLAVRSSSLLEDAMHHPFAGVYATKMIPNNLPNRDARFKILVEAIKYVWASTYFDEAMKYIESVGRQISSEKMAVIIQEVVGRRFGNRFYPQVSGVARSYNYYPSGTGLPEQGVVSLALGMGKTIVDGGSVWSYSPASPKSPPPFNNIGDMMKNTQRDLWVVNMGKSPQYNPLSETEYMEQVGLDDAEYDNNLRFVASTYDPTSDRVDPGVGARGPRILTFAPLLVYSNSIIRDAIHEMLVSCKTSVGKDVEVEFAITYDPRTGSDAKLSLLQVRPMVVSNQSVIVSEEDMTGPAVVLASDSALGNGLRADIEDIVYLRPEAFDPMHTWHIANELAEINTSLSAEKRQYLLIGFGRFGTSDPTCGIPVTWSQISGARAIVEASLPGLETELSQGSHFFHNVTSFKVLYFTIRHTGVYSIDWSWLDGQAAHKETQYVRHLRITPALAVRVDGRSHRGLVRRHLP